MNSGLALETGLTFPWMFGRKLDTLFYFAPLFVAVVAFALTNTREIAQSVFWATVVSSGFGAGPFHGGPTWFIYFDKRNTIHYSQSLSGFWVFFVMPPIILVLSVAGMLKMPHVINAVYIFWTIQHLVQQNVGILLLYHNHKAQEAIVNRTLEKSSLYGATIFCTLVMVDRINFEGLGRLPGLDVLVVLAFVWALGSAVAYLFALFRQFVRGRSLNVPALAFWLLSLFFFVPSALWGKTGFQSVLIPLVLHWFQYIGLNYMLVHKKYAREEAKNLPGSHPLLLLSVVCTVTVVVVLSTNMAILSDNPMLLWQRHALIGFVFGLSLVHYYLDAFIWRFRDPYQRESILPYLIARGS